MTRILYLRSVSAADTAEPESVDRAEDIEVCAGQDACIVRATELADGGTSPPVVVIGLTVSHPLSAARAVRAAAPRATLAIVSAVDVADSIRQKIALSPDISDTAVITGADEQLVPHIRQIAQRTRNERRVQDALEEMNLELRQREVNRRAAQAKRSVSDRHLSALTRHAPDAIISVDTSGAVASWNRAASEIFGHDVYRTEGTHLGELVSPEGQAVLHDVIQRAVEGSPQPPQDMTLCRDDGSTFTAAVTAAPVLDEAERVVGVVVMARDVTRQRHAEEHLAHLQKAQSLATLAGGVAHDFNNLLVSVQGWSELALEEPDDRELTREALELINKHVVQAAALARQMLVYSGRTDLTFEAVDLNEVVENMGGLLRSSLRRQIDLETILEPDLPPIQADPAQLRQVVLNLVTNAAEALGEDRGRVQILTSRRDERHVILSVADTGPGMDPDTVPRIFEPFFTTKFTGRGLGLAASIGIAQAHGGTIEVETEPGAGSRFHLVLPIGPSDEAPSGHVAGSG